MSSGSTPRKRGRRRGAGGDGERGHGGVGRARAAASTGFPAAPGTRTAPDADRRSQNSADRAHTQAAALTGSPAASDARAASDDAGRVYPMRLQKFLARAGVASRRGSEDLMTAGRVSVNASVVTELGSKVDPNEDEVRVDGRVVRLADGPAYLMLHKPAGYLTTMSDPHGRPTVAELVPCSRYPGLYPVGRLDMDTTGLLLFSTDGDIGQALLHPKHHVSKTYEALVEGVPSEGELDELRRGIVLDDGPCQPAEVRLVNAGAASGSAGAHTGASCVEITISEGRKRQVKRMFSAIHHCVVELHRARFGPLELGDLPAGGWRVLTAEEVAALKAASR